MLDMDILIYVSICTYVRTTYTYVRTTNTYVQTTSLYYRQNVYIAPEIALKNEDVSQ